MPSADAISAGRGSFGSRPSSRGDPPGRRRRADQGSRLLRELPFMRESDTIAAPAEHRAVSTLKVTYGNEGQYDELEDITRHI